MGDVFTDPTITDYNSNPPPDDGSTSSENRITYSGIKTKLGDPLETAIEALITATGAAFDKVAGGVNVQTGNYTVLAADQGQLIVMTGSDKTLTTPAAATVQEPFRFGVLNQSATNLIIDGNASETIDGSTTLTVPPYSGCIVETDGTNWRTHGQNWNDGIWTDVASVAGTTDLGAVRSGNIRITGTNAMTGFGTIASGVVRRCRIASAGASIIYNATSMILPTAATITCQADDSFLAVSLGSGNWIVLDYQRADGTSLIPGASPFSIINGSLVASVAANALTIAVKTLAGADPSAQSPVWVMFRSSTVTGGTPVLRKITAATSVVVSSGSTLGFASAETNLIHAGFIDNSGTVELAVSQDGAIWTEDRLVSTTAEGGAGAADSRSTLYSTTARTNVPCRLGAIILITTGATPGQWSNSPTRVTTVGANPITPYKGATRAWATINATGTLLDSLGVASTTDNGTGDQTVTFAVAMGSANYVAHHTAENANTGNDDRYGLIGNSGKSTTAVRVHILDSTGQNLLDAGGYNVSVAGF